MPLSIALTPGSADPGSADASPANDPGSAGVSPAVYTGSFEITEATPTGTAYAIFSACDLAGNRGTEIETGGSFEIDTDGPAVTRLVIQPEAPIQNDEQNPVSLTITIGLDEEMKSGESPNFSYELSGPGCVPVPVENLALVDHSPLEGGQGGVTQAWQGTFTLPADAGNPGSAGASPAEDLSFIYQGVDDLDNVSNHILADNLFEVYQGDLPALEAPAGLTAESLPGGVIKLTWNAVELAAGYQLYRKAPGESALTEYLRLGTLLEYTDGSETAALPDGTYTYAIASVRQENGQEAFSDLSAIVEVVSDATPPAAPQNLTLLPVSQGIFINWDDPDNTESVTYRLYRAAGTEIPSIEGLTPVFPEIPAKYRISGFLDPNPSTAQPCYAMTAVDALGNESAPSNSVYHNVGLLPVSDLQVRQQDNASPVISWNHPSAGSMAGYNISLEQDGEMNLLNAALLTERSYTDMGYAGNERRYAVTAVDHNGLESVPHSITLPSIQYSVISNQSSGISIKRGMMNRLEYEVKNLSSERIDSARLKVQVETYTHYSTSFSLEPGESQVVPVIVGGYADLPDIAHLTTTVEITPMRVRYCLSSPIFIPEPRRRIIAEDRCIIIPTPLEPLSRIAPENLWTPSPAYHNIHVLSRPTPGSASRTKRWPRLRTAGTPTRLANS